tara:strand:+ start:4825 stop:5016 length:192 start_codon:yes stop_codon:yes gene_type:complete
MDARVTLTRSPTVTYHLDVERVSIKPIVTFNRLNKCDSIVFVFLDLDDNTDDRLSAMSALHTY